MGSDGNEKKTKENFHKLVHGQSPTYWRNLLPSYTRERSTPDGSICTTFRFVNRACTCPLSWGLLGTASFSPRQQGDTVGGHTTGTEILVYTSLKVRGAIWVGFTRASIIYQRYSLVCWWLVIACTKPLSKQGLIVVCWGARNTFIN